MKVAYTLTQCSHEVPGGSAAAALSLWRALRELPTEPGADALELVAVGARGRSGRGGELPEPSVRFRWPYPVLYELWNRSRRASVESLVPDADIVHTTLGFGTPTRRARQVCTVHDLFPFSHPEVLTARGVRVMRAGMARVLERADRIVTPSEASADEVLAHGADPATVRVVPWAAEPMSFSPAEVDEIRGRHGLPERYVLFVGTVEPRKNLEVLLDALERTPDDVHLVLVGPAGWGDTADRVAACGGGRVSVLGRRPRRELLGLMSGAAAVCLPSLREGFGLPALEAMAQATPVIHSTCPALCEVVGGTGVAVDAHDIDGWAAAMTDLVADAAGAESLGSRGAERARQFTWARSATAMLAVYEELR